MRLTLDWDDAGEMNENLDALKQAFDGRSSWQVRRSSSGEGYHAEVWDAVVNSRSGFQQINNLRERFGDDPKRLELDRTRWDVDSPMMQILFTQKYIERREDPPYTSGNSDGTIVAGDVMKSEDEQIKDPESGRLDYHRMLRIMYDELGTQKAVAERIERSRSTVSEYLSDPSRLASLTTEDAPKKRLKRWARSQGIGHYVEDGKGGKSVDEIEDMDVEYRDPENNRRTVIEYIDVPWGEQGDDREYKLAQIETTSLNPNHTDGQIDYVHDRAAERVQERLSPTSPRNDVTLDLDRDLKREGGWEDEPLRHPDSKHYESVYLDDGESDVYIENMPVLSRVSGDPQNHIITEVLLWDEDMTTIEWQVQLVDDGDDWEDHTVLKDTKGWW